MKETSNYQPQISVYNLHINGKHITTIATTSEISFDELKKSWQFVVINALPTQDAEEGTIDFDLPSIEIFLKTLRRDGSLANEVIASAVVKDLKATKDPRN